MATAKIILKTDKAKSDGEAPLYLRIIKDRKAKFISLGFSIHPKHWNEKEKTVRKSHPNSVYLKNFLAQKLSDALKVSLELETSSKKISPKKIKQAITGRSSESFFPYALNFIKNYESSGQIGTFYRYRAVIAKLEAFVGTHDFTLDDIDLYFLKKYEAHLRDQLNNAPNTIQSNMKVLRRIINEAANDELMPFEKNPFLRYKLHVVKTEIEFLTEEELTAIENLNLVPGSMKFHHRNIYIFAAYAGGIRISDIITLTWKNFDGERILINTKKTGSVISVMLPRKALEIINLYQKPDQQPHHFIFPFLSNDTDYSNPVALLQATKKVTSFTNNDLIDLAKAAGINKHIHFHTSRHTWATRALRKGMRIEYVSKLMGHASIKTTQVYAKIVNEELDKAMDVFN